MMKHCAAAFCLFFLLFFWALPVDAASPFSSEKTYRITETELSRLESDLDRALEEKGKQKEQSERLRKQLRERNAALGLVGLLAVALAAGK